MKVTYYQSSTVVIEHKGVKVLCDPWLTDGIYYGSWFYWPVSKFKAKDLTDVDYIYISHVHPDHFDENTVKEFPKNIPILICEFQEKFLLRRIKSLGFEKVIEVSNRQTFRLGDDFDMEVFAGDDCDSRRFSLAYGIDEIPNYKLTKQIDSLAIFASKDRTVINSNDVPVALIEGAFQYIQDKYGRPDFLLVSYAGAGPFPQCSMMPNDEKSDKALRAAYAFLGQTFRYITGLKPRFYMPYAGGYILGGKNYGLNQYKGVLELDELLEDLVPQMMANVRSEVVMLDQGETWDVDKGQASSPWSPTDFEARHNYITTVLKDKKYDYEGDELPNNLDELVNDIRQARSTLWRKQLEFNYFKPIDVYIDMGLSHLINIPFDDNVIKFTSKPDPDRSMVVAKLDPRLMRRILDRRANWNNAEIGSHIELFDGVAENDPASFHPMPHFMMSYFQKPHKVVPTFEKELVSR